MNIYSEELYAEILENDAVYKKDYAVYNKKFNKNQRRSQRKQKQAARDRFYDSY